MTVRRKLFLALAAFITAMSIIYILVTTLVVNGILQHLHIKDNTSEIENLSGQLLHYFEQNNDSWDAIQSKLPYNAGIDTDENISFILLSSDRKELYRAGDNHDEAIMRLGTKQEIRKGNETIAILYYYDQEVANINIMQLGVSSSVTFILLVFAIVMLIISLLVAYWYSKKFTSPLQVLITAIKRLGNGEFGTQTPVLSKDEYGTIAQTFNAMSVQLQRAEKSRRNLVADVAHELRTPLAILRGQLELIQQSGRTIEPQELLPLQDELIRLTKLVDDLHQLSLAESHKLTLNLKHSSVPALLKKMIGRLSEDAADREIIITLVNKAGEANIVMDTHRMTQVFLNLLTNAFRYTPNNGTITINVEREGVTSERPEEQEQTERQEHTLQRGQEEWRKQALPQGQSEWQKQTKQRGQSGRQDEPKRGDWLRITIADTGSGIAPEHLPHIFNRFYRTDEARDRHSGGMGLGLAIAKQFVLAHNGTIEAASVVRQGTTFTVRLPYDHKQ